MWLIEQAVWASTILLDSTDRFQFINLALLIKVTVSHSEFVELRSTTDFPAYMIKVQ
jgi:hypothetical protein